MRLSYNGAPFCGWQRQPNAPSVQQTIEEALATVLRVPVPLTGAGRTDTGVNALCMYAHFDADLGNFEISRLINSLNRLCGRDISIEHIQPMAPDAHARFDATERTYRYFVTHNKNPFLYPLSWHCPSSLDYEAMNKAAQVLLKTDDFTSFAKLHTDTKTNICHVTEAIWEAAPQEFGPMMCFTITADRFLRNMVRAVVGTLVEVGRGKISKKEFEKIIALRNRSAAGNSMPPQALFLWDIGYPRDIFAH